MTQATIKGINAEIEHRQVEIVKGHGYFYFMPTKAAPLDLELPDVASVYTCHLRDMSKAEWVDHVEHFFTD